MKLRQTVNLLLNRIGYDLRAWPVPRPRFMMSQGLARMKALGVEVGTILDLGASNGQWAKLGLKQFPQAGALLFEPLAERSEELRAFCAERPGVDFVAAAAGAEPGEANFFVAEDLDGSGLAQKAGPNTRAVPITTIDHEVRTRNLPGPYLVKFDTHGFELPILAGATETLKRTSLIVMEVYNFQLNPQALRFHEMCAHLETLGFRCADLADPLGRERDGLLWQIDMFFLPKGAAAFTYPQYA
jgi:FkbM family methyltransferase